LIGVIDISIGNIGSVIAMLEHIGSRYCLIHTPSQLSNVEKIILPGVGAFDTGVTLLKDSGLYEAIQIAHKQNRQHILGICLGAQLLGSSSEEGTKSGLGCIDFDTLDFRRRISLRTPHMGWNRVKLCSSKWYNNFLDELQLNDDDRFYFVHRYYMQSKNTDVHAAYTLYENLFCAIVSSNRTVGVQFHPEKSSSSGLKLMKVFANYVS
jgi:glutamine amidotransferase